MARTTAKIGYGTQLKIGNGGGPETFTLVGQGKVTGFDAMNDVVEATNFDSDGGAAEYVAGILKFGPIQFDGNYIADSTQQGLYTDLAAGTVRNFQLIFPSATSKTVAFVAIVNKWSVKSTHNGLLTLSATLQVTGLPTIA